MTGVYEDFLTGFVLDEKTVWGRQAGIAVTQDGALLVSDDANGTIFGIAATKPRARLAWATSPPFRP